MRRRRGTSSGSHRFERVIHLAAQPGVRFVDPQPYAASNLMGFMNMLEACRHGQIQHLVYASSSSVYGANRKLPFSEHDGTDHPISLYAATKKANEMMAHSYASLFGLPATGLRFFTVYGPWGRPDMAVYKFTHAIARRPRDPGRQCRQGLARLHLCGRHRGRHRAAGRPGALSPIRPGTRKRPIRPPAPRRTGSTTSATTARRSVNHLIALIEDALGRKANRVDVPLPPGDVLETRADVSGPAPRRGLRARDLAGGGHRTLRRMVSRVSRGVS